MTPTRPPSIALLAGEGLGFTVLPRLALALPALSLLPRGKGEPVMVLPGFGGGDASTLVLRALLAWLGYRVEGWGLGINRGNVPELIPQVGEGIARMARDSGQKVRLVGWSLGGILAREATRDAPQHVARIVTLGSPVIGGPKYTQVGLLYQAMGADLDDLERQIAARNVHPLPVPVTSVYTRADGIVDWRACIDPHAAHVEHVEVSARHLTLGFEPEVLRIVAERLARAD